MFLDTETTSLEHHRRAWEISLIRREAGGPDTAVTVFVELADLDLPNANPESLTVGRFHQRHPAYGAPLHPGQMHLNERDTAALVDAWTAGAEIIGVRPRFDTTALAGMLHRQGRKPRWWRNPVDITDLARGWVLAHGHLPDRNPEALSRQCAVTIPDPTIRHTAYGDADWVRRWFDTLHTPAVAAAAAPPPPLTAASP